MCSFNLAKVSLSTTNDPLEYLPLKRTSFARIVSIEVSDNKVIFVYTFIDDTRCNYDMRF